MTIHRTLLALTILSLALAPAALAGDLTRGIRLKISAGDLRSAEAMAEDWRRDHGEDSEYLDALGWLARGAQLLGRNERAIELVEQLRRRVEPGNPAHTGALGAAIEVEGRVLLAGGERATALAFWRAELARTEVVALRSRITKNIAMVTFEGSPAPEIDFTGAIGQPGGVAGLAGLEGRPVLLFFWAHWCGDCRDQASAIEAIRARYADRGLVVVAPTRLYGTAADGVAATPEQELAHIRAVLAKNYSGLEGIIVPVSQEAMVTWGVSATPTIALVDADGVVQLYTPTRMSLAELEQRVEVLLAAGAAARE